MPDSAHMNMTMAQQRAHDALLLVLENALDSGNKEDQIKALDWATRNASVVQLSDELADTLHTYTKKAIIPASYAAVSVISQFARESGDFEASRVAGLVMLQNVLDDAVEGDVKTRSLAMQEITAIIKEHPGLATRALFQQITDKKDNISPTAYSDFKRIFREASLKNLELATAEALQEQSRRRQSKSAA